MKRIMLIVIALSVVTVGSFIAGVWTGDPRWTNTGSILVIPTILGLLCLPAYDLLTFDRKL